DVWLAMKPGALKIVVPMTIPTTRLAASKALRPGAEAGESVFVGGASVLRLLVRFHRPVVSGPETAEEFGQVGVHRPRNPARRCSTDPDRTDFFLGLPDFGQRRGVLLRQRIDARQFRRDGQVLRAIGPFL